MYPSIASTGFIIGQDDILLSFEKLMIMEIKPDRWNEMQFLPGSSRVDTAVWMHHLDANKTAGEARQQLHKNVESNIE